MALFMKLKFKSKLGYECWRRGVKLRALVNHAVKVTLEETRELSQVQL